MKFDEIFARVEPRSDHPEAGNSFSVFGEFRAGGGSLFRGLVGGFAGVGDVLARFGIERFRWS
jgi:hypothetical protein